MKAPMILPWVAKKAGISEELALKLWRRAASEAEYLVGQAEGSEYWGLALERFIDLAEEEADEGFDMSALKAAPSITWWWRHQSRMSRFSMVVAQNTYRYWHNVWDQFYHPEHKNAA
jgi:hypothetical protein